MAKRTSDLSRVETMRVHQSRRDVLEAAFIELGKMGGNMQGDTASKRANAIKENPVRAAWLALRRVLETA